MYVAVYRHATNERTGIAKNRTKYVLMVNLMCERMNVTKVIDSMVNRRTIHVLYFAPWQIYRRVTWQVMVEPACEWKLGSFLLIFYLHVDLT